MSRNVEFRQPMRETRGFSRAQTGDGITAVLPMTWSITMLMHASTHSVNFDENTTGTTFTFTVIAYQWGWNYYFPRDIVDVYWATPKLVGQGHADVTMDQQYYDHLLDYTRKNVSAKQTNAMRYANKMGKNVAPNALALFLRTPFTLSDQQLPLFFDSAFAATTQTRAGDIAASRALASEAELAAGAWLGELLDECGAVPRAAVSETSSQQLAVLAAPSLGSIYTHDNWVATDVTSQLAVFQPNNLLSLSAAESTAGFNNFFLSRAQLREDMMRYRLGDALRTKSTLVVASNRLTLVHQNHTK